MDSPPPNTAVLDLRLVPQALSETIAQALEQSNWQLACQALSQALSVDAQSISIREALALAHQRLGEHFLARAWESDALRLAQPGSAEQLRLGLALVNRLLDESQDRQAATLAQQLLHEHPGNISLLNAAGFSLANLGQRRECIALYRQVLLQDPQHLSAHANLGAQLWRVGEFAAAIDHARQAVALNPNNMVCQRVLGEALLQLNQIDAARQHLVLAQPDPGEGARATRLLAFAALLNGEFALGWDLYQQRWAGSANMRRPDFYQPASEWNGQDIAGQSLLVYQEQGYGDVIQFVRFLPRLQALGIRTSFYLTRELQPLVQTLGELDICDGTQPVHVHWHVALLELPRLLGINLSNIAPAPYLSVLPERASAWTQRLAPWRGQFKLGLAWSGRPGHDNDVNRSFALRQFAPFMQLAGVQAFSLQVFLPDDSNDLAEAGNYYQLVDLTAHWQDWGDSAAQVQQMDLVITIDSAVAHLVGALGKPVWVLLPPNPDWRWLLEREDSPWYGSARLFRRGLHESKEAQVERVLAALQALLSAPLQEREQTLA